MNEDKRVDLVNESDENLLYGENLLSSDNGVHVAEVKEYIESKDNFLSDVLHVVVSSFD